MARGSSALPSTLRSATFWGVVAIVLGVVATIVLVTLGPRKPPPDTPLTVVTGTTSPAATSPSPTETAPAASTTGATATGRRSERPAVRTDSSPSRTAEPTATRRARTSSSTRAAAGRTTTDPGTTDPTSTTTALRSVKKNRGSHSASPVPVVSG